MTWTRFDSRLIGADRLRARRLRVAVRRVDDDHVGLGLQQRLGARPGRPRPTPVAAAALRRPFSSLQACGMGLRPSRCP